MSCYELLSSITQPQSVCFFISRLKVSVGIKISTARSRKKSPSHPDRQTQLVSRCVSGLNTNTCHLTSSTACSCSSFPPTCTEARRAAPSISALTPVFVLTFVYIHRCQLLMWAREAKAGQSKKLQQIHILVCLKYSMSGASLCMTGKNCELLSCGKHNGKYYAYMSKSQRR